MQFIDLKKQYQLIEANITIIEQRGKSQIEAKTKYEDDNMYSLDETIIQSFNQSIKKCHNAIVELSELTDYWRMNDRLEKLYLAIGSHYYVPIDLIAHNKLACHGVWLGKLLRISKFVFLKFTLRV